MEIRLAREEDRMPLAVLHAEVAAERKWIGAEPPVDVEARAARWDLERTIVATIEGELVGLLFVIESGWGFGEIGMTVAASSRRRGVGAGLMLAAIDWARSRGLHKLTLDVFPHNTAAIALYERFGFVQEGRRVEQIRRRNGEYWDLIEMGLLL
jgi:RimJ/RimL family protein N-acetyltransferase